MRHLRTLAILVFLAVSRLAVAEGLSKHPRPKPAADAAAAPAPATPSAKPEGAAKPAGRPEPPSAPRKYLEAAAKLFNSGRIELASKYLQAAQMYRDKLTASEQIVLDVYREKVEHYFQNKPESPAPATAPPATPTETPTAQGEARPATARGDTSVVPASNATRNPTSTTTEAAPLARPTVTKPPVFEEVPSAAAPSEPASPDAASPRYASSALPLGATGTWRDTADTKQKARWLLQLAREQIHKGHYEIAQQAIAEARSLDVKWTLWDETPDRLSDALVKARTKAEPKGSSSGSATTGDRRTARVRLKEARAALAANDVDRAEEIVREVRSWGVSYSFFDDTPDKVATAIMEARRREPVRSAAAMLRTTRGEPRPKADLDSQATPAALPEVREANSPGPSGDR